MKRRSHSCIHSALATLAAMLIPTGFCGGATVSYVGGQFNFESVTNDSGNGWRNTSTSKPLDGDGDNIFGTDGYEFGGNTTPNSLPSYVNSFNINGGHNDNGRGDLDDPADPGGVDINGGWAGRSSVSTTFATFSFNQAMANTIRLGVIYDNDWNVSTGEQIFSLTQTVGGSDTDSTPTLTLEGNSSASYDIIFFDIEGIQSGDTFTLNATDAGTAGINWLQITGMTFDTVPEPSTALLGGLGTLLLLRRRK